MNKELQLVEKIAKQILSKNGRMYFVGGYVRDKILEKDNKDIDVEIFKLYPEEVSQILQEYGKVDEIGACFGVLKIKGIDIDFCFPRKEKSVGDQHTDFEIDVEPNISTYEASKRRDFTMNALMQDVVTSEIIDHFNGVKDIENKLIRHIDDKTFVEDKLRVLRAAQFASRFDFKIHPDTIELCKSINCTNLSKERIYKELEKALIKSTKPSIFFENIKEMGLLGEVFSPLDKLVGLKQVSNNSDIDVFDNTMLVLDEVAKSKNETDYPIALMLASICNSLEKIPKVTHESELHSTKQFLKNITNENLLKSQVFNLVKNYNIPEKLKNSNASDRKIRELIVVSNNNKLNINDLLLLSKADITANNSNENIEFEQWWKDKIKTVNNNKTEIIPLITGKDLLELGFKPGPNLGKLLKTSFDIQLDGLTKNEILDKLEQKNINEDYNKNTFQNSLKTMVNDIPYTNNKSEKKLIKNKLEKEI